jgi:PKD repeat protein
VSFTDTSSGEPSAIAQWYWEFGDGGISTSQHPTHTYTGAGTYMVTLTVTDTHGCTDTEVKGSFISTGEGPTVDFAATPTSCCAPLTVYFTDTSTAGDNTINAWRWAFGDGDNSTAQNPNHTYNAPGVYTVTLTVSDTSGCSIGLSKSSYITVNQAVADFDADPLSCCAPLEVAFTDQSTATPGSIALWRWEFGDGGISTSQHPTHTYTHGGVYTVTLTVTDTHGCSVGLSRSSYITANQAVADFDADPLSGYAPLTVYFTDTSTAGDNPLNEWYWVFGDGGASKDQDPTHTYDTPGVYTVTLTVTDTHGCTDTTAEDTTVTVLNRAIFLAWGWNLMSFNVDPPSPLVEDVLQSIDGDYDRVLGEYGVYIPTLPITYSSLSELHSGLGYFIRITETGGVDLLVEGVRTPITTPLPLHDGWNWIGYLPNATLAVTEALQSIDGQYSRVLSLDKVYDPALPLYITLHEMRVGEGYLIRVTGAVTLTYPAGGGSGQRLLQAAMVDACHHVAATPFFTLLYGELMVNGRPAPPGTTVQVVTPRGDVAGCFVVHSAGHYGLLHVYGQDPTAAPLIAGFRDGEPLRFRVDGSDAVSSTILEWRDDKEPRRVNLHLDLRHLFLPVILRQSD